MAKLYFYYSAMNAGKTASLLQSAFNYRERGMKVLILAPFVLSLTQKEIVSRIGIKEKPIWLAPEDSPLDFVRNYQKDQGSLSCVLVDEAQFLTPSQVKELSCLVDEWHIPVLTYGLRTDFRGELFPGSQQLLAWADEIREIKTVCFCGKKAIMSARIDAQGKQILHGEQIQLAQEFGGPSQYASFCRYHHQKNKELKSR